MQQFQQVPSYQAPYAVPYRPVGVPPIKRAAKRLAILAGVIVGGILLLGGGFYLYMKISPQHEVLVDNGNAFAVEVDVGGEHLSLAPRASATVKAHDGELTVKATGPNGFSETATVTFPRSGWSTRSRTAVYNIGGKSPLAVVSVVYGSVPGAPKPIVMLPPEPRLALLPIGSYGAIDGSFPEEVTTRRTQLGVIVQRVCHVDVEAKRVGCGGIKGLED
jgi:hypothetical protein